MSNYSAQFKPSINVKSSKSQQVQDPTKFPTSLEVPTIFSQGNNNFSAIPEEVKASVSLLHSLPSDTLANIIQNMLDHLLSIEDFHADSIDIDFINLQRKQLKLGELKDQFSVIYTALYQIIRTTVRNKINLSTLRSSLQLFNYPSPVSEKLVNHVMLLRSKAYSLQKFNQSFQCKWPTVAKLRWRIDVVISSGSLSRVMRPNIIMQMILSDGRVKTFDVTIEQFSQLRYAVAKLLLDMQTLERHPIMRIVNEFKAKENEELAK